MTKVPNNKAFRFSRHPSGLGILWLLPLFSFLVGLPGCRMYQFGADALFPRSIQTVYLPIVRNNTFRHDLGVQLNDALVREIERRTPYKVTGDPNADSTLACQIVSESKQVLTETDTDDPRALDTVVAVKAQWTGRGGQLLMNNRLVPVEDPTISFGQEVRFVPEAGQSVDTANQRLVENLAERIVSQMEMRW
jgi:hypothetical protein